MREDSPERMISHYDRHKTNLIVIQYPTCLTSETAHHGPEYLIIGLLEIAGSFCHSGFINVPALVLAGIAALVVFRGFLCQHACAAF